MTVVLDEAVAPRLDIFARAEKTGRLNTLDRACIRAAAQGALRGTATSGMLLLVNCEPTAIQLSQPLSVC